jgi:hypothetical protein
MKGKSYLLVITILCLAFGQINAQENFNISSISQYYHNWNGRVADVCVSGEYAYVACGEDGLRIVDISEAGAFRDVGRCGIGESEQNYASAVTVSSHYAYLGTYADIWVIDISDPANAQIIHNVPIAGNKYSIHIDGDNAFICGNGVSIVDISDPANAAVVWSSQGIWEVSDIDIQGNIAYLAAGEQGMKALDISDINSPHVIDSCSFSSHSYMGGVSVSGGYAFLAYGGLGFQVLDLSTMQIAASIDSLAYAFRIRVRGSYAYLTYGDPECPLAVIDISNPLSPQTLSIYYPPQDIVNFALAGELVYVADFEHGLRMIDVSDPQDIHEEYVYNKYGHDSKVMVRDNYAFVQEEYRIATVDMSNPYNPYEVSSIDFPQFIRDMHFAGNVAFICHQTGSSLEAIDYSNPTSPVVLGSFHVENAMPYFSAIYDHYAYILEYGGLRIIDISDPSAMYQAEYSNIGVGNCFMTIFDHYAVFQTNQSRMVVYDLTDPLSPLIVGGYDLGYYEYCNQATVADGKLYTCTSDKFWIFDISDLDNWSLLSVTDFSDSAHAYLTRFDIVDNFAYLAIAQRGLCIMDISDAGNPQQVGLYQTPGYPQGIDVVGNMAVVSDYYDLGFYDCSQAVSVDDPKAPATPQEFALLPNYPNPFNASTTIQFEMPRAGHVSLMVYDILGRSVSTLADGEFQAGRHSIRWDGTSSNGKIVASGRYLVRAATGDDVKTVPIMLLK